MHMTIMISATHLYRFGCLGYFEEAVLFVLLYVQHSQSLLGTCFWSREGREMAGLALLLKVCSLPAVRHHLGACRISGSPTTKSESALKQISRRSTCTVKLEKHCYIEWSQILPIWLQELLCSSRKSFFVKYSFLQQMQK